MEIGAKDAEKFLELGQKIIDPSFVSVASMAKRFESGDRDRTFLKDYLLRLSPASEEFDQVLQPFQVGMKNEGLLDENSWAVFKEFFFRPDSEEAKYFLSHRKDFEAKYDKETVMGKAIGFYYNAAGMATYDNDKAAFDLAKAELAASGLPTTEAMLCEMDIRWYQARKDNKNFVKSVNKLLKVPYAATSNTKNTYAWIAYENCDSKKELKSALKWVSSAIENNDDEAPLYFLLDTKAMLQLKLGKKEEGFATAALAIEEAKKTGEDYSETEKEMEKYK
jgi:hypothetical protein